MVEFKTLFNWKALTITVLRYAYYFVCAVLVNCGDWTTFEILECECYIYVIYIRKYLSFDYKWLSHYSNYLKGTPVIMPTGVSLLIMDSNYIKAYRFYVYIFLIRWMSRVIARWYKVLKCRQCVYTNYDVIVSVYITMSHICPRAE